MLSKLRHVPAEELWMQLEKLGIRQNGVHPVLGKAADQIETLVQKK